MSKSFPRPRGITCSNAGDDAVRQQNLLFTGGAQRVTATAGIAGISHGPNGEIVTPDRPARFTFGRIATASTAAVAAALTLSLSTPAAAIPRRDTYQGTQQGATSTTPRGGLRGTIRQFFTPSGQPEDPLPRVTITARKQGTGVEFTVLSATDGTYELLLPKGRYDVLMTLQGFVTCQVDGVDIGSKVLVADANLAVKGFDGPDDPDVIVTGQEARQRVPVVREKVSGCNNPELNPLAHKAPTGWK